MVKELAVSRIRDLSVGKKLYGGFGILCLLLIALAGTAFWMAGQLSSKTNHITGVVATKVAAGNDVKYAAADVNGWQNGYVLDHGASRAGFEKSNAHLVKALATAKAASTDPADLATVGKIESAYNAYMKLDATTWAAVQAHDYAKAQRLALGADNSAFNQLAAAADSFVAQARQEQVAAADSFSSTESTAKIIMGGLSLAAIVLAGFVAFLIGRMITRGLEPVLDRLGMLRDRCASDLKAALEAMAGGDLTMTVTPVTPLIENPSRDEIGQAASAVNEIRNATVASVEAYNKMRNELSRLIGDVSGAAGTISASSQQMASTSEEAGRAVGEIASAIGEVAEGAERQARMVERANTTSAETSQAAEQAREVAMQGAASATQASEAMSAVNESTTQVTEAIQALAAKSELIGGIVETITGLADQTNLLALNAAIEAARAGEQGRGFAVVAEEVRKLAEQSQEAAGKIAGLISEIQAETGRVVSVVEEASDRTGQGTSIVEEAREAFAAIDRAVQEVTGKVSEIATATGEVASVAQQTSASTEQVSASTQETSASAEELAASAQELAATATTLETLVSRFKTIA
jgi:methyl-accepting chemotaxis protein